MGFDERMLDGIGVLMAVVDHGSFARASASLDMTQSGVSRAIARLENRLGIRLFDRTTRSVTLTDDGRRFFDDIVPLLAQLEETTAGAAQGVAAVRGRLRVNVDPLFSRLVLGPQLGSFVEAHPHLTLDLVMRDHLGDMIADGFDLAFRFGFPRVSTLVARKLMDIPVITVAAPSYLKRRGTPRTPADLESGEHACIHYRDPETGRPFPWEFHRGAERLVVQARGRLIVNDASVMHTVCLGGHGIAQVLQFGSEALLAEGRLVPVLTDWPDERFPLYALYPSRQHLPAKVRAFVDFVVSLCER
ncbi:LysR family transcriptional regulator [Cupriavidus sp. CV2]|uniref:LysR family transcriptional regulator n=1 Tax=Cupriavidus ulmosensis TaxID=3065913 RepID=UPI00296B46E5|nr:LysR family transcriptional regulator [Cupriavidus sp. CV2]MDW3681930.1 LysR family transcriptional regulator [Cupriavidus sp. CV2]